MKRYTINEPSFIDRFFKANGPPPRVPGLALTIEIGTVPSVPCIATDEEAEHLFGTWARGMVSAVKHHSPPVAVFNLTAGVCSRCGAPCSSQMVRYTPSTGKADALCGTCLTREAEMRSPDWFAAEERATR